MRFYVTRYIMREQNIARGSGNWKYQRLPCLPITENRQARYWAEDIYSNIPHLIIEF